MSLMRGVLGMALVALLLVGCDLNTSLAIAPADLPPATVGQPYSVVISASDSAGHEVIMIVPRGTMAPGLAMRPVVDNTAELSGTPTTAGTYQFTIVADGYGMNFGHPHGERRYTLVVR